MVRGKERGRKSNVYLVKDVLKSLNVVSCVCVCVVCLSGM